MEQTIPVQAYIENGTPTLDVRSPCEYRHGHIPGALNIPLFSDEERARIGTLYKKEGQQKAFVLGIELVGPKLASIVTKAQHHSVDGKINIHCWRGGMRSQWVGRLLAAAGLKTNILQGGYKAFRRWILDTLSQEKPLVVVGGLTGSGKTAILHALKQQGEQTLDLEQLAAHRGSAFGTIGMPPQTTTEQFENEIAVRWHRFDPQRPIWIEDENRMIGINKVPDTLYDLMRKAPLVIVERPLEERLDILCKDYALGCDQRQSLKDSTSRIAKRLGGVRTKEVLELLDQDRFREAAPLLLDYYDKTYRHSIATRTQPKIISAEGLDDPSWATLLTQTLHSTTTNVPQEQV